MQDQPLRQMYQYHIYMESGPVAKLIPPLAYLTLGCIKSSFSHSTTAAIPSRHQLTSCYFKLLSLVANVLEILMSIMLQITHNKTIVPCVLSIASSEDIQDPGPAVADSCISEQVEAHCS